jgi:hypothetical protein
VLVQRQIHTSYSGQVLPPCTSFDEQLQPGQGIDQPCLCLCFGLVQRI